MPEIPQSDPTTSLRNKEGGFQPAQLPVPPVSPRPSPTPTSTPRPSGCQFFDCFGIPIRFDCCTDPIQLLTGRPIGQYLNCWQSQLVVLQDVLVDVTIVVVSGEPEPEYIAVPSDTQMAKDIREAEKKCPL